MHVGFCKRRACITNVHPFLGRIFDHIRLKRLELQVPGEAGYSDEVLEGKEATGCTSALQ